jgi:hypothetical protein
MLTYSTRQDRPRAFLAATGLTHDECARVLRAFAAASAGLYPPDKTWEGKARQRQGGGAKGVWSQMADKLLFMLVYQKTNPLQTMHGLPCGLSQPQTPYRIHHLLPVLPRACADLGMAPERDASQVATRPLPLEGAPQMAIEGTERRRQRPQETPAQQAHYSGKKTTHTDKHILLVNEVTSKVVSLGPTEPGKTHDKNATDQAPIASPSHATRDKDPGFPGYEPERLLTMQPQKNHEARP